MRHPQPLFLITLFGLLALLLHVAVSDRQIPPSQARPAHPIEGEPSRDRCFSGCLTEPAQALNSERIPIAGWRAVLAGQLHDHARGIHSMLIHPDVGRRGGESLTTTLVSCRPIVALCGMAHAFSAPFASLPGQTAYAPQAFQFEFGWNATASDLPGQTHVRGDSVTLTWSVVPDGTLIPGDTRGGGEPSGPSDLVAHLDNIYGDPASWLALIEEALDWWSAATGNTYLFEPNDDGATFPHSPGVLGLRGDIRFGGHRIDGPSGLLAYSFLPNFGDTVIDTADPFLEDTSSNSLRFRNLIAHEHGHQLGLRHVCPADGTKLMEPQITTAFEGPQEDDILSAQRLYGDRFEPNDSPEALGANADLGSLDNSPIEVQGACLDGTDDTDVYRVTAPVPNLELTARLRPTGSTYHEGTHVSGVPCSPGTLFSADRVQDLSLTLMDPEGNVALARSASAPLGGEESITAYKLPAAGDYFIKVDGSGTDFAQAYELIITATDTNPLPEISVQAATADEGSGKIGFLITLSFPVHRTVTAEYRVESDSATAGTDFQEGHGTIEFAPGETQLVLEVELFDDDLDEDDETLRLLLDAPAHATLGVSTALGVIVDDDPPPTLSLPDRSVIEADVTVSLPATLSGPSGREIRVSYATKAGTASDPDDYTAAMGTLVYQPGETEKAIELRVHDDFTNEANEWFAVEITEGINVLPPQRDPRITIVDNDPVPSIDVTPPTMREDGGVLEFIVQLSAPSGRMVSFSYAVVGGSAVAGVDYSGEMSGLLSIPPGSPSVSIPFSLIDDSALETDKTIVLRLSGGIRVSTPTEDVLGIIADDESIRHHQSDSITLMLTPDGDEVLLSWPSVPGRGYGIEHSLDLDEWDPVAGFAEVVADALRTETLISVPLGERGFFRIRYH